MMLVRLDLGHGHTSGPLYWMPDVTPGGPTTAQALAGPFADRFVAYWWFVAHLEDKLSPARLVLWAQAVDQLGPEPDVRHLMGLMMGIAAGQGAEWVRKSAVPIRDESMRKESVRRVPDYRQRASGERAA